MTLIAFPKVALPAWLLNGTFTVEVDEKLANRKFEEALSLMALSSIGSKLETDSSDILTAYFGAFARRPRGRNLAPERGAC